MPPKLLGIHHVTALAKDPSKNIRFYRDVLGMRFIKNTVNFDDPGTYHFYFADRVGTPGSVFTTFPHPHAGLGRKGAGEVSTTILAIPEGSAGYWKARLAEHGIKDTREVGGGDRPTTIEFEDHDSMALALVERPDTQAPLAFDFWEDGPVSREHAIRRIDGVRLRVRDTAPSRELLTDAMGFAIESEDDGRLSLTLGEGGSSQRLELVADPDAPRARMGAGSIHHVAWRVADDADHLAMQRRLMDAGVGVTEVKERYYFRSIYFREPGGVIFEIATDGPGFTVDEDEASLGTSLRLPPMYEGNRKIIEQALPEVKA